MPSDQTETPPIITLTTDFGLSDTYVAQMKGVILGINPNARIIDITHQVRPQQISQAAFLAQTAWPAFAPQSIHIAVVDPGVGTERRALLVESERGRFLGPDNGVLSAALPDDARPATCVAITLPESVRAFELTNERYMRHPVSATFHGRDIFSPAAAYLSMGLSADELGTPVSELTALPPFRARPGDDGMLIGQVVHIDWYGNVVTDIRAADMPEGGFAIDIGGQSVPGPYRTFADLDGLGAVIGGSEFLGIAAPSGSAADVLNVDIGAPLRLRPDA